MIGVLNINKPAGLTSRRVVDSVVRLVHPSKVGHAGTLDPLASGVLVVCVGRATRLVEYVQRMPKHYIGTFLLGRSSPTLDVDGPVTVAVDAPQPELADLEQAAVTLTGLISQCPPAYSAIKVAGRRAYDLARAGKEVDLAPRPVHIHRLAIVSYEYPELVLDIACSSGTYVRSLGSDLATAVGTSAVMSDLVRTAIGGFALADAVELANLNAANFDRWLLPARRAVEYLPTVQLSDEELRRVIHGQAVSLADAPEGPEIAGLAADGSLAAVLLRRPDGQLRATRVVASQ